MFNSRAINIALIASFVFHAALIIAVNIVVLPTKFKVRKFTSISFLGPILEKRALDIRMANKAGSAATNYESDLKGGREIHDVKSEVFQVLDIVKKDINARTEKRMNRAFSMPFREAKDIPAAARNVKKVSRGKGMAAKKDTGISGPLAAREVFYRPVKPVVPGWISSNTPFNLELKFFVTAQGDVKEVIPVVSSGNAEIDILGIRYLKEWKFTPLQMEDTHMKQLPKGGLSLTGFMPLAKRVSFSKGDEWGRIKMVFSKE